MSALQEKIMSDEIRFEPQPNAYQVTVQDPVAIAPSTARPEATRTRGPQAGRRTAILVCHGMGQQVPFSTLNSVVHALFRAQGSPPGGVEVQMLRAPEGQLPRVKVLLRDAREQREREVHLYEAYWAVLAEGQITATEVMKFLLGAGVDGIRGALRPFERWMFGGWQTLPRARALANLLLAVAVVCSIALYGYAFLATAAGKTLSLFGLVDSGLPLLGLLSSHVFAFLFALFGVVVILAVLMLLYQLTSSGGAREQLPGALRVVNAATGGLLLLAAAPTGLSLVYHAGGLLLRGPAWLAQNAFVWTGWVHDWFRDLPAQFRLLYLALWAIAAVAVFAGRWFLMEYVGDVAIYVTAHKLNRFNEVRQRIKEAGQRVANAVYEARDSTTGEFEYGEVIVVGHSLGSVVAYDTLNGMINRDLSQGTPLRVVERTKTLLTFGSPLDKTAFLFRAQTDREDVRESLAAAVQPLIRSYRYRPDRWINIFSRLDWISGALEYYDDPAVRANPDDPDNGKAIQNLEDPEAIFPLYAHTQYWDNRLFREILYREVMRAAAPAPDAAPPND
jgi:hypothetical protein